jgi:hypothetical protein
MNVYQKLQIARLSLQEKELKKSGKNKFAGYEYFELQDFLPTVQNIFGDTGLTAVFSCDNESATLTVYNIEKPEEQVQFKAPMAAAELKGCHPVQNLGASISYLRRYLYVNALEIVEHDALDATTGNPAVKADPKPKPKTETITVEGAGVAGNTSVKTTKDWEIKVTMTPEANEAEWFDMVWKGATLALGFAQSDADVMSIFKTNKTLFDDAKNRDSEWFKKLMEEFTKTKNKFKEQ